MLGEEKPTENLLGAGTPLNRRERGDYASLKERFEEIGETEQKIWKNWRSGLNTHNRKTYDFKT